MTKYAITLWYQNNNPGIDHAGYVNPLDMDGGLYWARIAPEVTFDQLVEIIKKMPVSNALDTATLNICKIGE